MSEHKDSVSEPTADYSRMQKLRALAEFMRQPLCDIKAAISGKASALNGTALGVSDAFLVRHPIENPLDYDGRVSLLQWWDPYWTAMMRIGSRPFTSQIGLPDDLPGKVRDWLDNDVDGSGRDLRAFARSACIESAGYGLGYINAEWRDDLGRPVLSWVPASAVIGVDMDPERPGVERLRISARRIEMGRWTVRRVVPQIAVIRSGDPSSPQPKATLELWEEVLEGKIKKWVVVEEERELRGGGRLPLSQLPTGFVRDHYTPPPMGVFAELVRLHVNKMSNMDWTQKTAGTPLRYWSGVSKEEVEGQGKLSTGTTLWSTAADSKMSYVEHTGKALESAREDLERIERRMEVMSASPMVTRPSANETAFARRIDAEAATSQLEAWVLGWQASFSRAVSVMAGLADEGWEGQLDFPHDFVDSQGSMDQAAMIQKDYLAGNLAPRTYIREMKRLGVYSEAVDVDKFEEWVATQGALTNPDL